MNGSGGASGTSLLSLGFSAAGDIMKGYGQQQADTYQAERLEQAAQYGEVQAAQTSGQLTQRINQTLGNIDTIRAAAHTDPTSPTGAAVRGQAEEVGTTQREIAVGNIQQQVSQETSDAQYMQWAGSNALLMGALGAGADVAKGVAKGAFSPLFPTG